MSKIASIVRNRGADSSCKKCGINSKARRVRITNGGKQFKNVFLKLLGHHFEDKLQPRNQTMAFLELYPEKNCGKFL